MVVEEVVRKVIKVPMELLDYVERQLEYKVVVSRQTQLTVLVVGINTVQETGAVNGEEDVMQISGGKRVKDIIQPLLVLVVQEEMVVLEEVITTNLGL